MGLTSACMLLRQPCGSRLAWLLSPLIAHLSQTAPRKVWASGFIIDISAYSAVAPSGPFVRRQEGAVLSGLGASAACAVRGLSPPSPYRFPGRSPGRRNEDQPVSEL